MSLGIKHDSTKPRTDILLFSFPRALLAVTAVATFGADKYGPYNWLQVANGRARYIAAGLRHLLAMACGEMRDPETNAPHLAHAAWNFLAALELDLREPVEGEP